MLAPVVAPAVAWAAVLACCLGAVALGRSARTPPRRDRWVARRVGLAVSLSGPWAALLAAAGTGAWTGRWLFAAVAAVAGIIVVTLAGLALTAR